MTSYEISTTTAAAEPTAVAQATTPEQAAKPVAKAAKKTVAKAANVKPRRVSAPAKPKTSTTAKVEPKVKPKKVKLVRDSFTMPASEYDALAHAKKECLKAGIEIKKSELLRVAMGQISKMSVAQIAKARDALAKVQTGRPKK